MSLPIRVLDNPAKKLQEGQGTGKPAHWVDAQGSKFHNPWPSFRPNDVSDRFHMVGLVRQFPAPPKAPIVPIRKPTWGEESDGTDRTEQIKATWLGHACFLIELPSRSKEHRGARILFDPVWSDRCSPSQWMGPKRFSPPPCKIEDIPEIDAIVISHNHYDHLDTHTITTLFKRKRTPHVFAPLGNGDYFKSLCIPTSHTHIMDWWDSKRIEVSIPSTASDDKSTSKSSENKVIVDVSCTPGQHFTGRSLFDNFKSLWASWVVEEVLPEGRQVGRAPVKAYFAGDTGYRTVRDGQDENNVPTCPAFKEIGEKFGGFDFAMIPIGAYMPRQYMSPIHCAPQDSVLLFKDVKAKKALGMHWATWILTTEDVTEPPKRLAEECKRVGIEDGAFNICDIGETLFF
ncbi:N-acyl-phosphatidylethanolamine-hydrolyzing phospholipase D [Crucibulum laeve]|uniref:N-acyl-phosphatidylethanolamine-hydrolyzing phospholipase D n=1 Tax=Crucibulum laeve TaxID=68775 RepID=A0A5C3LSX2_9AGAR|nr:N-acyl-phosphatidylethanolamine-hydrolyzing phospholipase D [Crucibulum laeve]